MSVLVPVGCSDQSVASFRCEPNTRIHELLLARLRSISGQPFDGNELRINALQGMVLISFQKEIYYSGGGSSSRSDT